MKLHLSPELSLPIDAVTQTFAFLARRGAGKTYGASKLCEEMLGAGAQVVVLDPVGNWYGLRLAADGKGKGLAIPVLGGLRGDIPLEPGAGALVADLLVDKGTSAVLDVSMMRKGDRKRFATDFGEQLFHRKKAARTPIHLFIEEAQVFVPQRVQADEARMLGAFEDLVKLGRNFGIGVTLISQRPQAVNKDALNQTECLVVLQTNGAQERKALKEWIVDQGLDVGKLVDELPGLAKGEAYVWSPSWLGLTKRIHVGKKKTFNASATPEVGARAEGPRELAPVDLEQLELAMKDTIARASEEDPKALRRRVAELEREVAKKAPAKVELKEVPIVEDKQLAELEKLLEQGLIAVSIFDSAVKQLAGALKGVSTSRPEISVPVVGTVPGRLLAAPRLARAARQSPEASGELGGGPLKLLQVLARNHLLKVTRAQLGTLSGYTASGGTFGKYFGALKRDGLLQEVGDNVSVTPAGMALLGTEPPPPPQTTEEVLAIWRGSLELGPRTLLDELVKVYPDSMSRGGLGGMTGYTASGGTFGKYLGILKRNGLVELEGDQVRASPSLFLTGRAA